MKKRWSTGVAKSYIKNDSGGVITAEKLKKEPRRGLEQRTWEAVHEQGWQGKLTSARS